ncbi:MAG: porin [Salaquimonas sp.]
MEKARLIISFVTGILIVSSALAGEPVTVEAESESAVIACDKYGEGFVYVPGTQTCVKISGEVRTTFTTNTVNAK